MIVQPCVSKGAQLAARGLILLSTAMCACELAEVEVPLGEPVVVVHGVMRPDLPEDFRGRQFVVVERSFSGEVSPELDSITGNAHFHRYDSLTIPYGGYPSTPIEGALVSVSNLDYTDDPCGASVLFTENADGLTLYARPGIYWAPQNCPTMRAGDRLELRVETSQGEVVSGLTRVPGMASAYLAVAGDSVPFGGDDTTTFNRDTDTLRVGIEAEAGRLLQFEVRRSGDLSDFGTKIHVDSTAFRLPADVVNSFVIGDEDDVFRAGREYIVSVALTDSNYFDFSRSRNNKFTGHGFINHLIGGIGLFGSLVASSTMMHAVGQFDDPREGSYRLVGTFGDSVAVDLDWELYVARDADDTELSAFVEGSWAGQNIRTSVDGHFLGAEFSAVIVDTVGATVRSDTLLGVRVIGEPWQVIAFDQCGGPVGSERCSDGRPIIFRGTMEHR